MDYVQLPYVSPKVADDFQRRRNVLVSGPIDRDLALRFMLLIKDMESESQEEPIWVIIDSAGGDVQAGWTMVDSMELCKAPIHTVCYGEASSIAAVVFANGRKGNRHMLRHSMLMIHQPWASLGGWGVRESELSDASADLTRTRMDIEESLAHASGLPVQEVHSLCERDFRMDASEAIRLGFADSVL